MISLAQLLILLGVILAFILLFIWNTFNKMVRMHNQVQTDLADVDVQLRRKATLIEQLAQIVREYADHESKTFKKVAQARTALDTSKDHADLAKADNMFTETLRSLFSVVEAYPNLKADANYKSLQTDIRDVIDSVATYREEYNQTVNMYNDMVQTFPNLLVANLLGFQEESLFVEDVSTPSKKSKKTKNSK